MKFLSKVTLVLFVLTIFSFQNCTKESESGLYYSFDNNGKGIISEEKITEGYNEYVENPFISTLEEPTSTFSIDADGGSYSNVRRFLNSGQLPPNGAVRTEELINYFRYDYPSDNPSHPITLNGEISTCPWNKRNKLVRIGLKGKDIAYDDLPNTNFVFLIDVSGSMGSSGKLELVKESFLLFAERMRSQDKVAIVTYAGRSAVVLESTFGSDKNKIKKALAKLESGGSTAGAKGILTAYDIAIQNFISDGNNRVILATDGDFNVGVSSQDGLIELIEEKRETGVFLSVLGFGAGSYQDGKMEQLANNGNGTYEYIDNIEQGKKVFIHEFGKFFTVAKDVKVQVHFNPENVVSYRLIGYENRLLNTEDFEDDKKDAGEIGAGQEITALYEIVPSGASIYSRESLEIDFRYKNPMDDISQPMSLDIYDRKLEFEASSEHMRFAATTAGYGMMLIDSKYKEDLKYNDLLNWIDKPFSHDPYGYKLEFRELILKAKELSK